MKYCLDTHVHTMASGHAYSTLLEYVKRAKEIELDLIAITDHAPKMPGSSNIFQIANQTIIPRVIEGVKVLRGVEANIIDFDGKIDVEEKYLKRLDLVIASFHDVCLVPSTVEKNTNAFLGAIENPYVDVIGHLGNPKIPVDYETIVKACVKHNKIIEINNSSFKSESRKGSDANCNVIAHLCEIYGAKIIAGSDSHIIFTLGEFDEAIKVIENANIKEDNIMNSSVEKFINYLNKKGKPVSMEDFNE
ncbi:phosphatase [Helicovermis profundi]|uniref:Phosphatase n=1 Tax=Helicovermis profundi TaxID=3065157 RepID=A0AAU9E109_9FIRM|nr:phosphatase [Clostridia bacterium S502]